MPSPASRLTPAPPFPLAPRYHGVVARRPDGSYYYTHGAFLGHIVPGAFFILWGTWWLVATFHFYIQAAAARRGFASRAWYPVFFGPGWLRRVPLEPLIKIILPFIGINGELWLGHESWRTLNAPDGRFVVDNINDWQHSAMYASFMAAGAVDLLGHYAGAPPGTDRAFLGLAYLSQFLLLVFHLKGPPIEIMVHLILALQVAATVVAIGVEAAAPGSVVVASLRPALTVLQGVWWVQTAYILYVSDPAFDPEEMGGTMMTPVLLVVHMLWIAVAALGLLLLMRAGYRRRHGVTVEFAPPQSDDKAALYDPAGALYDEEMNGGRANGTALEMAGLTHHVHK